MIEKSTIVQNKHGVHARPAAMLVENATKYQSSISLFNGPIEADAKSIMGIMMLTALYETEIVVRVDGPDEVEALDAIIALFDGHFGLDS